MTSCDGCAAATTIVPNPYERITCLSSAVDDMERCLRAEFSFRIDERFIKDFFPGFCLNNKDLFAEIKARLIDLLAKEQLLLEPIVPMLYNMEEMWSRLYKCPVIYITAKVNYCLAGQQSPVPYRS